MRSVAILAIIYAATVGTASALIGPIREIWVDVDATDYDYSDADAGGCDPDGCVPDNTRDGSRAANSRWSCQGDDCCITYSFEEAQDIDRVRIAFHLGDERTRTLKVYDNGDYHSTITSSGETLSYEAFYLNTDETEDLKLCLDGDDDEWLSITEVCHFNPDHCRHRHYQNQTYICRPDTKRPTAHTSSGRTPNAILVHHSACVDPHEIAPIGQLFPVDMSQNADMCSQANKVALADACYELTQFLHKELANLKTYAGAYNPTA